jgi:hypothetical protein
VNHWRQQRADTFDTLSAAAAVALEAVVDLAEACEEIGDEKAARELCATASLCRTLKHGWDDNARALRTDDVPTPLPMIVTRQVRR